MWSTHSNVKPLLSQRKYSRVPDARPRAWRGLPPVATLAEPRSGILHSHTPWTDGALRLREPRELGDDALIERPFERHDVPSVPTSRR
jgi:hypothetical protein